MTILTWIQHHPVEFIAGIAILGSAYIINGMGVRW